MENYIENKDDHTEKKPIFEPGELFFLAEKAFKWAIGDYKREVNRYENIMAYEIPHVSGKTKHFFLTTRSYEKGTNEYTGDQIWKISSYPSGTTHTNSGTSVFGKIYDVKVSPTEGWPNYYTLSYKYKNEEGVETEGEFNARVE